MDFAIETMAGRGQMTFDETSSIMNNIYLSLAIKRGNWFFNPGFGSRLHELARAKNTEQTAELAKEYCKEALAWIIEAGRASAIDVQVERDRIEDLHRLKILVTATQADGRVVTFEKFMEVV